jgi:hypothetical protein
MSRRLVEEQRMELKKETVGAPSEANGIAATESKATPGRKPYQKPSFRFERVFETMALSCGKVDPTQKHCHYNRKVS